MITFFESTELYRLISTNKARYIKDDRLKAAYEDFVNRLELEVQQSQDYQNSYRMLSAIHNELLMYYSIQHNALRTMRNITVAERISEAERTVEAEQHLLEKYQLYPERFTQTTTTISPQLKWTASKADFMEYIIPVYYGKYVRSPLSNDISFSDYCHTMMQVFDVEIDDIYERKSKLLARKVKRTAFLSKLEEVLFTISNI